MSQVKVSANVSGSGIFTIASPNSNTDRTLTLPDATDTLVGKATSDTLTNKTLVDPSVTGALSLNGSNVSPVQSFRNKIINGNFDFWQRATSFTSYAYGGADRWATINIGSTHTTSRQSFTLGQTDVPGEPTYYQRSVVTSSAGAGNLCLTYQKIESVRTLAGQKATLSFWAKADATKNIAIEFTQNFGTGGSPSSPVREVGVTTCALTSSWQKFEVTVDIPSISGKTLGSDGNDGFLLLFWFDAGSDFNSRTNSLGQQSGTFDIAQVQLEAGSVATPFEMRPPGVELALCQRYFEKSYAISVSPGFAFGAGNGTYNFGSGTSTASITSPFNTRKRANPTVTVYDGAGTGGKVSFFDGSWNDNGTPTVLLGYESGFFIQTNIVSSVQINYEWTASAEL
jgi:hypothetical protein